MFNRFVVSVVAVVMLSSQALAVKLEYKVKPNETYKLRTKVVAEGEEVISKSTMKFEGELFVTNKITAANNGGHEAGFELTYQTFRAKQNDKDAPFPTPPPFTIQVKRDRFGKVLELKGVEEMLKTGKFDGSEVMFALVPIFPNKDLKVGDMWTVNTKDSPLPMESMGKLLALEKVDGRDCAKAEIKWTFDIVELNKLMPKEMSVKLSGKSVVTAVYHIALDTGWVVKGSGSSDDEVVVESPMGKMHYKAKSRVEMKTE